VRFKNKNIVITGGSSGIGLEMAREFIKEGAKVLITGRNEKRLNLAKQELGDKLLILKANSNSLEDISHLKEVCKSELGEIHALLANAGIAQNNKFGNTDETQFNDIFDINVKGVFFTIQTLLPLISKGGSILMTGSIVSFKGMPNLSLYNASKAAIRSFARSLANDLKTREIRVNTLSPGVTETPIIKGGLAMDDEAIAGFKEYLKEASPIGRMAHPTEIAKGALFLCSQDASYVNGIEFCIDGGFGQI